MRMGVGGLLTEIPSRPQPREAPVAAAAPSPRSAALVLAAGRSRRMGGPNKLLLEVDGRPMVRQVVEAALASRAAPVIVVLGHQQHEVRQALRGLKVRFAVNPRLRRGPEHLAARRARRPARRCAGAVVCLGDMPRVRRGLIDQLIAAFDPVEGRAHRRPDLAWQARQPGPVVARSSSPRCGRSPAMSAPGI